MARTSRLLSKGWRVRHAERGSGAYRLHPLARSVARRHHHCTCDGAIHDKRRPWLVAGSRGHRMCSHPFGP